MAKRFIACDREQSFLMPPDVREWLPEDHFAWFVLDAVAAMDLDAFYAAYRVDGRARPAYEPSVMVALVLYAYARGVRSSRAIERACVEDVAYRVLAAQQKPDHATLARFVERHQEALAGVFGSVLGLCARAGLVGVNVVAVDGSKISANASREATADYERLAREILEGRSRSTPRRTSASAIAAGMSCRRSWRPRWAAGNGSKRRGAGWMTSAPNRRGSVR
jgi:transposase